MAGAATFAGFSFASGWDLWYRGRWIRSPAQGSCQLIPEIGQLIQPDHDLVPVDELVGPALERLLRKPS
jgi:hypothetical protein